MDSAGASFGDVLSRAGRTADIQRGVAADQGGLRWRWDHRHPARAGGERVYARLRPRDSIWRSAGRLLQPQVDDRGRHASLRCRHILVGLGDGSGAACRRLRRCQCGGAGAAAAVQFVAHRAVPRRDAGHCVLRLPDCVLHRHRGVQLRVGLAFRTRRRRLAQGVLPLRRTRRRLGVCTRVPAARVFAKLLARSWASLPRCS